MTDTAPEPQETPEGEVPGDIPADVVPEKGTEDVETKPQSTGA